MSDYNMFSAAVRLTRNPEIKRKDANGTFAVGGLAYTQGFKTKDRDTSHPVFMDYVAFGRVAENLCRLFKKGDALIVQGEIDMDTWTDKDGKNRSKLYLKINSFYFAPIAKREAPAENSTDGDKTNTAVDGGHDPDVPF